MSTTNDTPDWIPETRTLLPGELNKLLDATLVCPGEVVAVSSGVSDGSGVAVSNGTTGVTESPGPGGFGGVTVSPGPGGFGGVTVSPGPGGVGGLVPEAVEVTVALAETVTLGVGLAPAVPLPQTVRAVNAGVELVLFGLKVSSVILYFIDLYFVALLEST